MSRISVLCVDDHPVVLEGIAMIIENQADMQLIGTATSGEAAIQLYQRHHPDITLMDLQLPGISGLEAIKVIRKQDADARIVVLTTYEGDEDIFRALQAGAVTYLLKNTLGDELIRTVRSVQNGERPIPADIAARLSVREHSQSLTPREQEILKLIARGMRTKEISADLGISEETAKGYIKSIFLKLKVRDRTAAAIIGLQRGIIHFD